MPFKQHPTGPTKVIYKPIEYCIPKQWQVPYVCKDCGKGLFDKEHIHTCSPQLKKEK